MADKLEVLDPMMQALDAFGWSQLYIGAFGALDIGNIDMVKVLTELTRSDEEAARVVVILRTGREGDRVWPALAWLRARRAEIKPTAAGGKA